MGEGPAPSGSDGTMPQRRDTHVASRKGIERNLAKESTLVELDGDMAWEYMAKRCDLQTKNCRSVEADPLRGSTLHAPDVSHDSGWGALSGSVNRRWFSRYDQCRDRLGAIFWRGCRGLVQRQRSADIVSLHVWLPAGRFHERGGPSSQAQLDAQT